MRSDPRHREATESGFTLVEVLVVLVVLAVGLLGGVALLLTGLRASRVAILQTRAANLAADLGERIRANRAAGAAYALDAGTVLAAPAKRVPVAGRMRFARRSPRSTCTSGSRTRCPRCPTPWPACGSSPADGPPVERLRDRASRGPRPTRRRCAIRPDGAGMRPAGHARDAERAMPDRADSASSNSWSRSPSARSWCRARSRSTSGRATSDARSIPTRACRKSRATRWP